jgi:tetratricopeptide (TPR) repeat protein
VILATTALLLLGLSTPSAGQAAGGDDALSRLRAAHEARPDDPRAAVELGMALYRRDNASREAQALLGAVAARLPKQHDLQLALLDSYLAAGDSVATAAWLERLTPELEADERFALDTTYCLLGRRRFPEARTEWGRVAKRVQASLQAAAGRELSPEADRQLRLRVAEVVFIQGLLTARLGDREEALRLLTQADGYGFPPLDSPLMMVAGDCLRELQEYGLAADAYREYVERAPESSEGRLRLGATLYASGKLGEAREAIEELLRRAPDYPRAHYQLGVILLEQNRTEEARVNVERELARDESCSACMATLARLAYLRRDDDACETWLARARALDPDRVETNLVAGMLAIRSGRYEQAIRHLTRAVAGAPDSLKARLQLATAYYRHGDPVRAREQREIYAELLRKEKARTLGVRGSEG